MGIDDPFFDNNESDRTIIRKPSPGKRGAGMEPARQHRQAAHPSQPEEYGWTQFAITGSHLNPLVDAATALFSLASQLRGTSSHQDIAGLRDKVIQEVHTFERTAGASGIASETLLAARYSLCTLLDEVVLSTPWGSQSSWSREGLLSTFHNETWGGEKFFAILENKILAPAKNLHLMELQYICMSLGLEGQYRVLDRGRAKLEAIHDNLFRSIRGQRGEFERELSPHWRGVQDQRNAFVRYVPLWVVGAITAALLLTIYGIFRFMLGDVAYPLFSDLAGIGRQSVVMPERTRIVSAPAAVEIPKLSGFLQPEIDEGLVTVQDTDDGALVRIQGDGLFRSGDDVVKEAFLPLMARIGDALNQVQGQVVVTGHTDNIPIRSIRFQSNWELSRARAISVMLELAKYMDEASRLTPEGRADTEPVAANDSPENRARNRRVEILWVDHGIR